MAWPHVVLSEARDRMTILLGDNAATPALDTLQKNDFLNEAMRFWWQATGGYPVLHTTVIVDVSVDDNRAWVEQINLVSTGGTLSTYVSEILTVHQTNLDGKALERISYSEILRLQNDEGTTGTPVKCAVISTSDAAGTTGDGQSEWYIYVYPLPTSNYTLAFSARYFAPKLSSDLHTIRLPDNEAWMIARLAAALAAPLLPASSEHAAELWRPIPARIQAIARAA